MNKNEIKFIGQVKRDNWDCYHWILSIKGSNFDYYTGLGHAKRNYLTIKPIKPKLRAILYAIALDYSFAQNSFDDFCSELGLNTDSRKALDLYLKSQENWNRLRKFIRSTNALDRILKWEL